MGKYLLKYQTEAEELEKEGMPQIVTTVTPGVAYVAESERVIYNGIPGRIYSYVPPAGNGGDD